MKYLLIGLFILYRYSSYSQNKLTENKYGVNVSMIYTKEREPATMFYFEKFIKKHSFMIGTKLIVIPPNRSRYYWLVGREFKSFWNRFGIVAGYHFFSKELSKNFNIGFEYLLQTSHYSLVHSEDSTGFFHPVQIHDGKEHTIENLFGYNIMVKLFKGFYLNQSAGFGLSFMHSKYFNPSKRIWKVKDDTYFKLGFQYIFLNNKK